MPIVAVLVTTAGTELRGEPGDTGEPEPATSDCRDPRE
jgi:hypothetical protein